MENLINEPELVVEKNTGELVLADKVHLLEDYVEFQERDEGNDYTSVFLMIILLISKL